MHTANPIPAAQKALPRLQKVGIPFILLTNGGGKTEVSRARTLSEALGVKIDDRMIVQSHTPFAAMKDLHEGTVLVVGGDGDGCREVAQGYGFKNVVLPMDILVAYPEIWPFGKQYLDLYKKFARPLPLPINIADPGKGLKIDAIFVYNDPRDWGTDATMILDLLLSRKGILGTLSPKNGDDSLPNKGYLQDSQPKLFYSNPDMWWAASWHQNRLGQGGFRAAFEGLWSSVTGGAELDAIVIGKPSQHTYAFAEQKLFDKRKEIGGDEGPLRKVYMVGDNPTSDIRGANEFSSERGVEWKSILVKTGVYREGDKVVYKPNVVVEDVGEAVEWAFKDAEQE